MTITNPGAIPNSGAIQFTNQISAIALINYNRVVEANDYNAFENYIWYSNNSGYRSSCSSNSNKKSKSSKHSDKKPKHSKSDKCRCRKH